MNRFVVFLVVFACFPHDTRSMCYLTGDACPICFITASGETEAVASYCPDEIDLEFQNVPDSPMVAFESYNVDAILTLNTSKVQLVPQIVSEDQGDRLYDLSHVNVHSCISKYVLISMPFTRRIYISNKHTNT